jgi:hypothetical protein
MQLISNIGLRDYVRSGVIWHGDFDAQFGKGATLLVGHGIRRDMIGHPIPPGAAAGVAQLDVSTDSAEELSGVLLFLS